MYTGVRGARLRVEGWWLGVEGRGFRAPQVCLGVPLPLPLILTLTLTLTLTFYPYPDPYPYPYLLLLP